MADFFENLDFDVATEVEQLSNLIYELRENRNAILKPYGAEDETALLQQILSGTVEEHPAYEHYLAARILADTREAVRETLGERLKKANK